MSQALKILLEMKPYTNYTLEEGSLNEHQIRQLGTNVK